MDTHTTSTLDAKVECLQSIISPQVKPGTNPIPVFAAMIDDVRDMRANGSDIEDKAVYLFFSERCQTNTASSGRVWNFGPSTTSRTEGIVKIEVVRQRLFVSESRRGNTKRSGKPRKNDGGTNGSGSHRGQDRSSYRGTTNEASSKSGCS